ncbi:hypothetical protein [Dyella flagellata]|uniref:Uncharacterized protein n=1 Tax=Dyella flagellata TaxID=1867833 RepID=A0ABQ5XC86_9GAMM|nr:hypothetical protein [Dyella flagellata]GLQ89321.1 hypothetical protein GCM10007898_28940 [Dyella flagellata]
MAELVVACFDTQFEASAAAEKLLSRGLPREQIVLSCDESVGNSPSSSSAPTTVISEVSHTGRIDTTTGRERPKRATFSDRTPMQLPDPSLIGHSTLVIELHGEMSMDDACALLESAGASSVRSPEQKKHRGENPQMWPAVGRASQEDVQRSVDAAKGGAKLSTHRSR